MNLTKEVQNILLKLQDIVERNKDGPINGKYSIYMDQKT